MPSKETLEKFMKGFHGEVTVTFNAETGEFEDEEAKDKDLGKPKTAFGKSLTRENPHDFNPS